MFRPPQVAVNSHFARFLPADKQGGDAHQHGNKEHAGTDAFDHTAHRLYGTEQKAWKKRGILLYRRCSQTVCGLTGLGEHWQWQEGVGEEGSGSDDGGCLTPVLIKQLGEGSDAKPAKKQDVRIENSVIGRL